MKRRPRPNVTWWRDNALIDASWETTADGATRNQLTLGPLMKPLSVAFMGLNVPLSAGRRHRLTCSTVGSRPPATISWWMADRRLTEVTQHVSEDGNSTTSTVTLTPRVSHDGQSVKCRAANSALAGEVIEQSRRLTVYYAPVVTLQLQTPHQGRESIAEGDDVTLTCQVSADPPAHSIEWKLNERPLNRSSLTGTEVTNGSLTLRRVTVRDVGFYTCEALSSEGRGRSNALYLPVRHAPDCKQFQKRSYETARGETVNVTCEVNSFPPPKSFFWAFNSTDVYTELPPSRVRSRQGVSVASVSAQSTRDYGTLLCWAENTVGRQAEPCVFALKPAAM
ncbi:neural cell adhesion molecule 1-like [Pollicipes pollicipes]|uniref:neural cell adhesion molecule 1-like n=1 Tax=Pollicipes pollicipes TaxID=41117 RepID=UPI001884903A|nr:neural cell adhesion molecule 1-like [Pollicipes pollicipes]